MATQANVTSTEALESFRSVLIVFLAKSKRALDDSGEEVRRMRQWVQVDQVTHWEGEFRRRKKQLEQAQQELMSAKLSNQQSTIMNRQMAVSKLQRDIQDAEQKIRKLKGWSQNFDSAADPIVKRMERLRQALSDLPKAIAYLTAIQKTLESYAESARAAESSGNSSMALSEPGEPVGAALETVEGISGESEPMEQIEPPPARPDAAPAEPRKPL